MFGFVVQKVSGASPAPTSSPSAGKLQSEWNPFDLYGQQLEFEIWRQGKQVGSHNIRFKKLESGWVVNSQIQISVKAFWVFTYEFLHETTSHWQNGRLFHLRATTNDNGDRTRVEIHQRGEELEIQSPGGVYRTKLDTFPSIHWNPEVLNQQRLINTITGELNEIKIESVAPEMVKTASGSIEAWPYRYSGDLEAQTWYDSYGRWVKITFLGGDGSELYYVCRRCGVPAQ